jgi:hypothetical protein
MLYFYALHKNLFKNTVENIIYMENIWKKKKNYSNMG